MGESGPRSVTHVGTQDPNTPALDKRPIEISFIRLHNSKFVVPEQDPRRHPVSPASVRAHRLGNLHDCL